MPEKECFVIMPIAEHSWYIYCPPLGKEVLSVSSYWAEMDSNHRCF